MLVIDANVALEACGQQNGFQALEDDLAGLVTIDMRLWRGAKRLGLVITPSEVEPGPDHKRS